MVDLCRLSRPSGKLSVIDKAAEALTLTATCKLDRIQFMLLFDITRRDLVLPHYPKHRDLTLFDRSMSSISVRSWTIEASLNLLLLLPMAAMGSSSTTPYRSNWDPTDSTYTYEGASIVMIDRHCSVDPQPVLAQPPAPLSFMDVLMHEKLFREITDHWVEMNQSKNGPDAVRGYRPHKFSKISRRTNDGSFQRCLSTQQQLDT